MTTATFESREAADRWIEQKRYASVGSDPGQTLATYLDGLGDRWARVIDSTSTYDPHSAGIRLRVLPAMGHLPVGMLTARLIDRAIDRWEIEYGRSTVKNTVAALVLVLDDAVRDGLLPRKTAKDRAAAPRTPVAAADDPPARARRAGCPRFAFML